jgi:hypothetical protein
MPGHECNPACCPTGPPLPVKAAPLLFAPSAAPTSPVNLTSCTGYARRRSPPAALAHPLHSRPNTGALRSHTPLASMYPLAAPTPPFTPG